MTTPRCSTPMPRSSARGFTLVELMVTITVMAILVSIAVPSFARLMAANRLSTQTNELVAALNLARMEALRRSQGVSIRSTGATAGEFHGGWAVFTDSDADGDKASPATTDDGTELRVNPAVSNTTTVTRVNFSGGAYATSADADNAFIVFNSRGAKSTGGSAFFKVCDSADASIPGRVVRVLTTGAISLVSTNESCS